MVLRSFWFRDYFGIIQNVIEIHESIFKNDIIETFIKFLFTNFKSLKSNFELNVDIHTYAYSNTMPQTYKNVLTLNMPSNLRKKLWSLVWTTASICILQKSIDWNNNSMIDIRLYAWLTSPIISNVHHHLDDWLHLGDGLTHFVPRSSTAYTYVLEFPYFVISICL